MPKLIAKEEFYIIKANYIEQNPVRKGYVKEAEDWVYSSANKDESLLELDSINKGSICKIEPACDLCKSG